MHEGMCNRHLREVRAWCTKPKVCKPGNGQPLKIAATSVPGIQTYDWVTEVTFRIQNQKRSDTLVLDNIYDLMSIG